MNQVECGRDLNDLVDLGDNGCDCDYGANISLDTNGNVLITGGSDSIQSFSHLVI